MSEIPAEASHLGVPRQAMALLGAGLPAKIQGPGLKHRWAQKEGLTTLLGVFLFFFFGGGLEQFPEAIGVLNLQSVFQDSREPGAHTLRTRTMCGFLLCSYCAW